MPRQVAIPKPISVKIGRFNLSRAVLVRLLTRIRSEIAEKYEQRKSIRSAHDERLYMHAMVVENVLERHLLRFAIDDSTSPEHLIIADIGHTRIPK